MLAKWKHCAHTFAAIFPFMKKVFLAALFNVALYTSATAQSFTAGNLVVVQTSGTASKASSQVTLKEYTTAGVAGISVAVPITGVTPFQSAGVYGGSEGFLTTSTDNKYLVLGGYRTAGTFVDITGTSATSVPRAVGLVYPSGYYLQIDTSGIYYSANDIRGGISDGTNFWTSGASNNSIDGIDYFSPGPKAALAVSASPPKAYGLRIFNGQIYYSTQKAGPTNTSSQLGIFALGTGLPTTGTVTVSQVINTGTIIPEDFSFDPTGTICYIAINLNTASGGIQKWTKVANVWSLAYTLGTGIANTGAYGLVVDYSGAQPVIYATTFDAAGNRVIKITDAGAASPATTLVAAVANVYYKGISFAPVASGTPVVNLAVSTDTASEAGTTVVTVTANTSAPVTGAQTVTLGVSGTGITAGDYTLSNTTITIPAGGTTGSVTFTVVNDILGEGTEIATLTESSPSAGIVLGLRTTQRITITDNDGNNHPTISMNTDSTTNYIDTGALASPASPFKLSGVIGDPTDPGATLGVYFTVNDLETLAAGLTMSLKSSNTTVVPLANLTITGNDTFRRLKIIPAAVGYSDITVTVRDGIDSTSYVINYAASTTSATPLTTWWHTGMSDASDAIAIDDNYYISGDDELDVLNVYARAASGMRVKSYNYASNLSLPDPAKPEVDVEAATRSLMNPAKVFWLGSMSNGKSPFDNKPNRDRLFATNVTGTGASTAFSFAGYTAIRTTLLAWGDANGYAFSASAAAGVDSKSPSGFAAEGMVFGPDSTTLYIGLRAPLVPIPTRTKAVIAPIQNFETWFNNGSPVGNPTYGSPIELDLGGRGIRDLVRLSNGTYVIVAGNPGGTVAGALYKWTGRAGDAPRLVASPSTDTLNMEGAMQVNVAVPSLTSLQVITDNGDDDFYHDGAAAKDFNDLILRKFSSSLISLIDLSMPPLFTSVTGSISKGTAANSCDTVVNYTVLASGVPTPTYTYVFSGATTGSGSGTGSGTAFNKGVTSVTVTATNTAGSKDSTFTITVSDGKAPVMTAPPADTVSSNLGYCYATNVALGTPIATDNCINTTISNNAPDTFYVGNTTVRWVATDGSGNTDTAMQVVTVVPSSENWTGVADSLWSNPVNWSCGTLPTFVTNVTIPVTAIRMPLVNIPDAKCNNITVNTGAQISFTGSNNVLEVKGDIIAHGLFAGTGGKVILSGAVSQQVAGTTYGALTIQGGSNKTLTGNATIAGILQLTNGYLVLGTNMLTVNAPASITGSSAASFIITNSTGTVTGQSINTATGTVTFPVGTAGNSYTPLLFSNSGTTDNFSVRVIDAVYDHYTGHTPTGAQQTEDAINKTWFVTEAVPGGSNATITPQWNQVDELPSFDRNACYASHYDNNTNLWVRGAIGVANGPGPYTRSLITTFFSPFSVGSAGSPLELKLLNFAGVYHAPATTLDWTTTGEDNAVSYTVERSADGMAFTKIGDATAKGQAKNSYQYIDNDAKRMNVAQLYYRLQLNYKNGDHNYSKTIEVNTGGTTGNVVLTPNPVTGTELYLNMNGDGKAKMDIEILNMQGASIKAYHYAAGSYAPNAIKLNINGLANGVYILRVIQDNDIQQNIRFSKQ